ncbi:T-cell surface glycoprotein CD3 epsilon chain [Platysternon megacephalum]|uniref:T-cell surface glycoprotein CD3 epsilon chain n=2 Tax=Platysternon megacephalum TaxID=55544 RepID=A0A4D9DZY0_9SAUR|nr:T-cell surface glycoprotein CD3 epsilon chain [Platysternon megacephalum]
MQCSPSLALALSSLLGALGFLLLCLNLRAPARYGKHQEKPGKPWARVPARCAWFLQELPSFLVPALLLALRSPPRLEPLGCRLLCGMFCGHYFHRLGIRFLATALTTDAWSLAVSSGSLPRFDNSAPDLATRPDYLCSNQ